MNTRIPQTCPPVNARAVLEATLAEARIAMRQMIQQRLNELLLAIVCHVLGRPYHRRRYQVSDNLRREAVCQRCHSRQCRRFSRNGFRQRRVLTTWDELSIDLPRVRCVCGGSVRLGFDEVLRPYQRIWDDVDAQIGRWGTLALSLRQMQQELAHLHISPVALQTLTQRLRQVSNLPADRNPEKIPPVVQVDAVWVTQLRPNGQVRRDRKGRQRPVKGRFKRPIFVAMGIWPDTGRSEILLCQLGKSESAEDWLSFLSQLEAQGIRGDQGLQLLIHDGGSGLEAALQTVYFGAAQQRCLFHKLRNIYTALRTPEHLTPAQRRRRRKAIFKDFRAIWQARRYETALRRYRHVVRTYRQSQPQAVATLRRDFRLTVTYYCLEQRFPTWPREHLRTTSRLERFNRRLRRRARAAGAYHSDETALAMVAQEAREWHSSQLQT